MGEDKIGQEERSVRALENLNIEGLEMEEEQRRGKKASSRALCSLSVFLEEGGSDSW